MSSGPAALGGKHQDGEGGRPPTSTQLPTQMQLLGAFVEALRLRQNLPRNPKCSLDDATSDRGFTGATETTEHWCCRLTTICQATGLAVLAAELDARDELVAVVRDAVRSAAKSLKLDVPWRTAPQAGDDQGQPRT